MARIRGTRGADVLNGTAFGDTITGGAGNDTIFTGAGNDYAHGGGGADAIVFGSGVNNLYGGSGSDIFAVEEGASGRSNLRDWQDASDRIDVSGLGISSLEGLTISTSGDWTVIDTGSMDVRIKTSLLTSALSADDFVFADPAPAPLPVGDTLYDFDNMSIFGWADSASRTGSFVADFEGWTGDNESPTGAGDNGYLTQLYIFGVPAYDTSLQADMTVMASDTFDFEAFETSDRNGFTLIGMLDGVEVGRQSFDGVAADWTEIRPDDAIFDVVDQVQFEGLASMDDMLIIA